MTDEIFYARRKQLTEAVKKAVLDLLAHEKIMPAAFEIALDNGRTVTVQVSNSKED